MKHLLLIGIVTCSFALNAQVAEKPVAILDLTEAGFTFKTIPPYQGGGRSDTATVIVDPSLITDLNFSSTKLFVLSLTTNRKAAGTLKEKSSYRIGDNFKLYRSNGEIKYAWEYYGQNAYGAEKKNTIVVTFDEKGVFKNQVIL